MRCRITLLLFAALMLLPLVATAEDTAADPALLAESIFGGASGIDCTATASLGAAAVAGGVGAPAPVPLTHCNAQQTCPGSGCFVSCTGHSSCTVQSNSVTCDGNVVSCPSCGTPPGGCLDPCCWCECKAAGGGSFMCRQECCVEDDGCPPIC